MQQVASLFWLAAALVYCIKLLAFPARIRLIPSLELGQWLAGEEASMELQAHEQCRQPVYELGRIDKNVATISTDERMQPHLTGTMYQQLTEQVAS